MKKTTITCDRCGEEISGHAYLSHIDIILRYWHGGSVGGLEDEEKFDIDLCGDCACELSGKLKVWLKEKEQ